MPSEDSAYQGLNREKLNPLLTSSLANYDHCGDDSVNMFPVVSSHFNYFAGALHLHGEPVPWLEDVFVRSADTEHIFMRTNRFFLASHSAVLSLAMQHGTMVDGLLECRISSPIGGNLMVWSSHRHAMTVSYILAWWHGACSRSAPCWEAWPHEGLTDAKFLVDVFTQAQSWASTDLVRKLFAGEYI